MSTSEFEQDELVPDFYKLDLIEDNLGRTSADPKFRDEFRNTNDLNNMGTSLINLYIANILG